MPTILHTLFLKNERTLNKVSYTQKEKNQSTQMAYGFCDDDGGASIQDIALAAQKQRTQMADGGGGACVIVVVVLMLVWSVN